jgi:hypothetical protein
MVTTHVNGHKLGFEHSRAEFIIIIIIIIIF